MDKKPLVHLDFGHGGKDPGAVGNGLREKDVVLKYGLEVGEELNRYGVDVSYSRTSDVYLSLAERATKANDSKADIFVSLHVNAATNKNANGLESFSHPSSPKGKKLAKAIQDELVKAEVFSSDRGIKTANFAVLRLTSMPASLVELGFITNKNDAETLKTKKKEIVKATTIGILKYLGINYVENKPNKPINEDNKLYKVQVGAYSVKANADNLLKELKTKGFDGFIVEEDREVGGNMKSKYYKKGDAHIIETTPDNIHINVLGDNLHGKGLYGINGTFFDLSTAIVSSPNSCVFIAMNDGKAISSNAQTNGYKGPARATMIYHDSGKMGFRQLKNINPIRNNTLWAIGGYMVKPYMDFKNEQIPGSINYKTAHTYVGYDKQGKIYLIVKPNHMIAEIVRLLDQLGITNAIVLDGGGSSQLNHPNGNYRSSRKINTAILLKEE